MLSRLITGPAVALALLVAAPAASTSAAAVGKATSAEDAETPAREDGAGDPAPLPAPADAPVPDAPVAEESAEDSLPGELTGDVALVSDYVDRGISNSNHNPAVQGGITYAIELGLADTSAYAGFWGSSVDFDDGDEATVEIDAMFGFNGAIGDNLSWDLGAAYYAYPGASRSLNYDYWEVPLQIGYALTDAITVNGAYYFSPNFAGDSGVAHYLRAGAEWELPLGFKDVAVTVAANAGHQWIARNSRAGIDDYLDWNVGLTVSVKGIDLGVIYTDTNLGKSDCFGGTNLCEPRVVFSLGTAF